MARFHFKTRFFKGVKLILPETLFWGTVQKECLSGHTLSHSAWAKWWLNTTVVPDFEGGNFLIMWASPNLQQCQATTQLKWSGLKNTNALKLKMNFQKDETQKIGDDYR